MSEELFTKRMQRATREIHATSDSLVNAKLSLALSDDQVWAEGLLVFYEIFRYLEEAMDRLPDTFVSALCIDGMKRTKAFQEDLNFYLTTSWTNNYVVRESVAKYLLHLQTLEAMDPNLLMPYIYHLYMGLLTGGQILNRKRELIGRVLLSNDEGINGNAITQFGNRRPQEIKQELKATMNSIAEILDDEMKLRLIEESSTVFALNNELIRSVRGTSQVLLKKLLMAVGIIFLAYISFLHLRDYLLM